VFEDQRTSDPSREAEHRETGEIVAREISNLPPRQREVLVLSAYEQLSHAEIARVLHVNEQNVRTNLHLARERLRTKLAKYLSHER
jgi:RNA polymerase sigma-70 factor (ECF subfamily)